MQLKGDSSVQMRDRMVRCFKFLNNLSTFFLLVYYIDTLETQRLAADDFGKTLISTPQRAGGSKGEGGTLKNE